VREGLGRGGLWRENCARRCSRAKNGNGGLLSRLSAQMGRNGGSRRGAVRERERVESVARVCIQEEREAERELEGRQWSGAGATNHRPIGVGRTREVRRRLGRWTGGVNAAWAMNRQQHPLGRSGASGSSARGRKSNGRWCRAHMSVAPGNAERADRFQSTKTLKS